MTTSTTSPHHSFRARGPSSRRRTLVSLTPLIDVVFILLLFFMLASSLTDLRAISLDAPVSGSGIASIEGGLLVDVRLDGVRLAGRYIGLNDLIDTIHQRQARTPELRVLVRPARGVSLQDTVRVLDALTVAGIDRVALMDSPGQDRSG